MTRRTTPLMIYDGDCSFCRIWIDYWKKLTGSAVDYKPYQEAAGEIPEIPAEQFAEAVHFITEEGTVYKGARAVFESLARHAGWKWMLWAYRNVPGVPFLAEHAYRFIARRRNAAYRLTRLLWGASVAPSSGVLVRWLFLRVLGLIYLIAFVSLGVQITGLVGTNGILPVDRYLQLVRENVGPERYWELPTLLWMNAGDGFLQLLCWGGALLSALLASGVAQRAAAFLAWLFYLSLFYAGQTFLSFQWDILLLETGFLAIFFAPGLRSATAPSKAVLWLLRLLLLRLMFFSGYVKLAVHDPFWTKLTALTVHYETQPLPTPVAWYLHQLPEWFQIVSCGFMFVIELAVPVLIFFPRRPRSAAAAAIVLLMLLIMLSGNYTFFNLLAIALCITLLDDAALQRLLPERIVRRVTASAPRPRRSAIVTASLFALIFTLSVARWTELFSDGAAPPQPLRAVSRACAPLLLVNSYGLFRVMTNPRREIIIEGSDDGEAWKEYGFRDKPGDLFRAPPWVEPHQPRLDWQMWFAALGSYRQNPWFVRLCVKLLEGEPSVLGLMGNDPFSGRAPRYLRAQLYEYHFTTAGERRSTGAWWKRELRGLYLPPISLRAGE